MEQQIDATKQNGSNKIIVDLEFTKIGGEIIRLQVVSSDGLKCYDFNSNESISPIADIKTGGTLNYYRSGLPLFSIDEFNRIISKDADIYGWGKNEDLNALKRYNINIDIIDLQDCFIYDNTEFVVQNGRSVEVAAYLLTGGEIFSSHTGKELLPLYKHYIEDGKYHSDRAFTLESVIPYGRFAGNKLGDTIQLERRSVDGYRFNNNDYLSNMFDYGVSVLLLDKYFNDDDDDDDDDDYFR